jgi:DNA-binding winged helix-turn-helix (wHTH) protein/TolB-like protein/tetratricopeptide (TPR) repeat protein
LSQCTREWSLSLFCSPCGAHCDLRSLCGDKVFSVRISASSELRRGYQRDRSSHDPRYSKSSREVLKKALKNFQRISKENSKGDSKAVMEGQTASFYQFGSFRIDRGGRVLLHDGEPVSLPPKVYDTLLALVMHSGQIVEKEELMRAVWPDTFVEEANLTVNISALRKALGEGDPEHHYIETVPRRGYRFVSPVTEVKNDSADSFAEEHAKPRLPIEEEHKADATKEESTYVTGVRELPRSRRLGLPIIGISKLVGLGVIAYYTWGKRAAPGLKVRSMAVLPFKPLVADNRDEPLEMGMCDALITRLSGLNQLIVRPTSSVVQYNKPGQDSVAAGRELGVDALLDGFVQKSGDKIRVTAQLLSIPDGKHLWSGQFNANFTDIFAVEDSMSRQMVEALLPNLTGEERRRVTKHYTENIEAYELYLRGRYFQDKRTAEALNKSIDYFQQATEKDPRYALAFAGLADSNVGLAVRADMPPRDSFQRAKTAAMRALEIDDTLAEAHASLANVRYWYDWDWSGAETEFKRAFELSPNYPTSHQLYASYLIVMGRQQEALSEIRQARALDPLSLTVNVHVARILFFSRGYDEAIEQCRKTLEIDPNFGGAHLFLGRSYKEKRMYQEALTELEKARDLLKGSAEVLALIGYTYAVSGRLSESQKVLQELQGLSKQRYVSPYHIAMVYSGLGERDTAFLWLEKAYDDREGRLTILKFAPEFDGLRSDSRYADLLRRIGLTP